MTTNFTLSEYTFNNNMYLISTKSMLSNRKDRNPMFLVKIVDLKHVRLQMENVACKMIKSVKSIYEDLRQSKCNYMKERSQIWKKNVIPRLI